VLNKIAKDYEASTGIKVTKPWKQKEEERQEAPTKCAFKRLGNEAFILKQGFPNFYSLPPTLKIS
jgi:hypothetical protein